MYMSDKSQRITLRLNENQFNFVKDNADTLGVSPSEFLRLVINTTMAGYKKASELATKEAVNQLQFGSEVNNAVKESLGRENDETNINN